MRARLNHYTLSPVAPVALALAMLLIAPRVAAQESQETFVNRIGIHAGVGGGTFLGGWQASSFAAAIQADARLSLRVIGPLAIEAAYFHWYYPGASGMGAGTMDQVGGGLRLAPEISRRVGIVFVSATVGYAFTGTGSEQRTAAALDFGLGYQYPLARAFLIGPALRYGMMFQTDRAQTVRQDDARYWSLGLEATLRVPVADVPPPAPPRDSDGDGVIDGDDQCPNEPAGPHPDATRRGCPARDTDGDGVFDAEDLCPSTPAGSHADPARRGCPIQDTDGDGVLDTEDQCPLVAAGAHPDPTRPGCPDGDRDNDGVLDHADQCPGEPAGSHPDSARPGCPLPDADGDSVPDAVDHCPTQPGAPDPDPNKNGCPGQVVVRHSQIVILQQVHFAPGRDVILHSSFSVLRSVANALAAQTEIRRVEIQGHTDENGTAEQNMELSQRRAQSVVAWLTQHGVDASRLVARGFGETVPLQHGTSAAVHRANRRVEFHIIDPAPAAGTDAPAASAAPAASPAPGVHNDASTSSERPTGGAPRRSSSHHHEAAPAPVHHHHHHSQH